MSITIEPLGGLGNQLFVYALGLHLAKKNKTSLEADLWRFRGYSWHQYELDSIPTQIERTYSSRVRGTFTDSWRRSNQVVRNLGIQPPRALRHLALETTSYFNDDFIHLPSNTRISGYFQSWRYFESVADQLRKEILMPKTPSMWLEDTRTRLRDSGRWIGVHVRIGNYRIAKGMGILGEDYYRCAIGLIDSLIGPLPIIVFSDEPETVKQLSCFSGDRYRFITAPEGTRPIESLVALSDASALIIGNSTFSWWAAFLQDSPDRVVIAPRPWLNRSDFNERDLFPTHWLTLGHSAT